MFKLTVRLTGGTLPRLSSSEAATVTRDAALAATTEVRENFVQLARRSGSRSFWHEAAALTTLTPPDASGMAVIRVSKRGVRLHYKGGVVRPTGRLSPVTHRPTRALLIPFEDSPLRLRGTTLAGLNLNPDHVFVITSRNGCPLLATRDQDAPRAALTLLGKLVSSTTHRPRPEVLPTPEALRTAAIKGARQSIKSIYSQ